MSEGTKHMQGHPLSDVMRKSESDKVFLPRFEQEFSPVSGPGPHEASSEGVQASAQPVVPENIKDAVILVLKNIYDPEIPVNIYALGLIYNIEVDPNGVVEITMTLTAPGCPVAGALVKEVADKSAQVPGVSRSHVLLVWDPPWTKDRMSDAAKLELGLF